MPAIRYRGISDEELQDTIKSLLAQKHTGQASVDFNGHSMSFNSPAHIESMIVDLEREIYAREAAAAGLTKRRKWLVTPNLPGGKGYL